MHQKRRWKKTAPFLFVFFIFYFLFGDLSFFFAGGFCVDVGVEHGLVHGAFLHLSCAIGFTF